MSDRDKNTLEASDPDWQRFFTAPLVYKFQIAKAQTDHALLIDNTSGMFLPYAYTISTRKKTKLGTHSHGQIFATISSDGREIYAPLSADGVEKGHMHAYAFDGSRVEDLTPQMESYTSFETVTSAQSGRICFFASFPDRTAMIMLDRNVPGSARELFSTSGEMGFPPAALSDDGSRVVIAHSIPDSEGAEWKILIFDTQTAAVLHSYSIDSTVSPLLYDSRATSDRILVQLAQRGYTEPAWVDIKTGNVTYLQNAPTHDIYPMAYDALSRRLVVCSVLRGHHQLLLATNNLENAKSIGPSTGSFMFYFGGAQFIDSNTLILKHQSSKDGVSIIRIHLDRDGSYIPMDLKIPSATGTPYQSIECATADGTIIQAWVGLPANADHTLPFVIDVHGVPTRSRLTNIHRKRKRGFQTVLVIADLITAVRSLSVTTINKLLLGNPERLSWKIVLRLSTNW